MLSGSELPTPGLGVCRRETIDSVSLLGVRSPQLGFRNPALSLGVCVETRKNRISTGFVKSTSDDLKRVNIDLAALRSRGEIPEAYCAIPAPGGQCLAVRREGQSGYPVFVARKRLQLFSHSPAEIENPKSKRQNRKAFWPLPSS